MEDQRATRVPGRSARPPASPEVVASPGPVVRAPRSRRRLRRWLTVFLAAWAVVVVAVGWAWFEYGRLTHDLRVSNRRVQAPVRRALVPVAAGAAVETTLVAGVDSHGHVAGTLVLARTDTDRRAVELLTVPSSVAVAPGRPLAAVLRAGGLPLAIRLLRGGPNVAVNHIVLIRLDQAGSVVGALGGITIANPSPVAYRLPGARGTFPAGRVTLTARNVRWYLDPGGGPRRGRFAAAGDARETAVIRGVTEKLIHLSTPSQITAAARAASRGITTDLSPDPVLGIVAARLRANRLVECRLAPGTPLWQPGDATVHGFEAAGAGGGCTAQPLTTRLPVSSVAARLITTVVAHGGSSALYWLVVVTMAIWVVAACAWVATLQAVRGMHLRLAMPANGIPFARPVRLPPGVPRAARHGPGLLAPHRLILVFSVPASVGLGILIARVLQ